MGSMLIIPPLFGMAGLLAALFIYLIVLKYDGGIDKVKKIADQIHLGAMVFMRREYSYLFIFVSVLIILSYLALGLNTAIAVTAGAISLLWQVGWECFLQQKQILEQLLQQQIKALKQLYLLLFMEDLLWVFASLR